MKYLEEMISAIENYNVGNIPVLVKYGADLNYVDPKGNTFLLFAIHKLGGKVSSILLDEKSTEKQEAALGDIAKKATSLISTLLENGVNVNYEDLDGCTALGLVKYNLHLGMLSFLPSALDGNIGEKQEAMQLVSKIFYDITAILIAAGADENHTNKFGETPSKYAERIMMDGINNYKMED